MADTAIETGLRADAYRTGRPRAIVWTDENTGYAFYHLSGTFQYRKTTNAGASWGTGVTIRSLSSVSAKFDIWYDPWNDGGTGTLIHTFCYDWNSDVAVYRTLDTATDTLGTARTMSTGDPGDISMQNSFLSMCKAEGGNIYFLGKASAAGEFWRSTNGTSFTLRSTPVEASQDLMIVLPAYLTDTQDVICLYYDDDASELSVKFYDDSANTWGNEASIGTMANSGFASYQQFDGAILHSNNTAYVAFCNSYNNAANDLKFYSVTLASTSPTITELTDVVTNTIVFNPAVFIDQNSDDIYVFYVKPNSTWEAESSVYYKKSTDSGSTWGTETRFDEDTADDIRWVGAGHMVANGDNGRVQPVWINDDLADLFTGTTNSIEITAGGGPVTNTRRYSLGLTGVG